MNYILDILGIIGGILAVVALAYSFKINRHMLKVERIHSLTLLDPFHKVLLKFEQQLQDDSADLSTPLGDDDIGFDHRWKRVIRIVEDFYFKEDIALLNEAREAMYDIRLSLIGNMKPNNKFSGLTRAQCLEKFSALVEKCSQVTPRQTYKFGWV